MIEIKSPLPGTFYCQPSEDSAPYKKADDKVNVGDVIGLVEVMKMFTEVQAEESGIFFKYTAEHGGSVMVGDVLAELKN